MQFYVLRQLPFLDDGAPMTSVCRMMPDVLGDARQCPNCGLFVSSLQWLPPYYAEVVARGRAFGDVAFEAVDSLLVSNRFRMAWLDAHLVGIDEFSPIDRIRVRPARLKKNVPTYFYIAPRLFDVQIDLDHSLIEYSGPVTCFKCKGGGLESIRGFSLDLSTWQGEDMFLAWGLPGVTIVSDRVRELRDNHGLTNVNLIPTENYFWDPYRRWTPIDHSPDDVPTEDEPVNPDPSSTN